jgi:hypothetical protein
VQVATGDGVTGGMGDNQRVPTRSVGRREDHRAVILGEIFLTVDRDVLKKAG